MREYNYKGIFDCMSAWQQHVTPTNAQAALLTQYEFSMFTEDSNSHVYIWKLTFHIHKLLTIYNNIDELNDIFPSLIISITVEMRWVTQWRNGCRVLHYVTNVGDVIMNKKKRSVNNSYCLWSLDKPTLRPTSNKGHHTGAHRFSEFRQAKKT